MEYSPLSVKNMMDCLTKNNISARFTRTTVELTCRECGLSKELPSLQYFKKWGYPKGNEKHSVSEWLHEREGELVVGDKVKIDFIDITNGQRLGTSTIPMNIVRQLSIGDRLEFKETGAIFGMMEIVSFAVNEGYPEGDIKLKPVKSKGKVKLQDINEEYVDSLIPF
jgi:hypothetical protein